MLLITIPKPCHENWNDMSPREQGAFCNVCSKTVIDFTALSDVEVKNYFLSNHGQKTCGRFKNTQLTNSDNILPAVLAGNIPFWKKILAIVVILFWSFLTGCKEQVLGKIVVPEKQEKNEYTIVGITLTEIETEKSKAKELSMTKGFISPVIIEDIDTASFEIAGEIEMLQIDTIPKPQIENQKIDSAKKIIPGKKDCDSLKNGSTNFTYYKP